MDSVNAAHHSICRSSIFITATWKEVDNSDGWSNYTFPPGFVKKSYTGHYTPTGTQVLCPTPNGARVIDGCELHYNGWIPNEAVAQTYSRQGAKFGDLKPAS